MSDTKLIHNTKKRNRKIVFLDLLIIITIYFIFQFYFNIFPIKEVKIGNHIYSAQVYPAKQKTIRLNIYLNNKDKTRWDFNWTDTEQIRIIVFNDKGIEIKNTVCQIDKKFIEAGEVYSKELKFKFTDTKGEIKIVILFLDKNRVQLQIKTKV